MISGIPTMKLLVVSSLCFVLLFIIAAAHNNNNDSFVRLDSNETLIIPDGFAEQIKLYKDLILKTYKDSVKNAFKILKFIEMVNGADDELYLTLFELMKINNDLYSVELMMLMHRLYVRELMDLNNPHYKYIYDNLPDIVRDFPWGDSVITIRNERFTEKLCVDKENKIITPFSVFPAITKASSQNCYWKIKTGMNENKFGFRLIDASNDEENEILYAGDYNDLLDFERRNVYVSSENEFNKKYYGGDLWMFEPMKNNNFRIYNMFYDEYLYALDLGHFDPKKTNRQVLLWKPRGCDGSACEFQVSKKIGKCKAIELADYSISLLDTDKRNRIDEIVCGAYQKSIINAQIILKWINSIQNKSQIIFAYRALFNEMKANDDLYSKELMMLVYSLRSISLEKENDSDIKYISDNLPSSVKKFQWESTIIITNRRFYEKICFEANSSGIFNAISVKNGKNCDWKLGKSPSTTYGFRLYDSSNKTYFLFAGNNNELTDHERRNAMVTTEEMFVKNHLGGDSWMFEPLKSGYFRIYNLYYGEYLYPLDMANYNSCRDTRPQLLWRPYGCDGNQCAYLIEQLSSTDSESSDEEYERC